jgi:3-oxosteroid 1-dehydrogenase
MAETTTWDLETDFVSVGSGIGGLAAAITAREQGLDAAVLEKANLLGGVTAFSYGEIWVAGNHLEKDGGIEDSPESGLKYVTWLGAGCTDPDLARTYAYSAPAILQYFDERVGIPLKIIKDFSDYYYPEGPDTLREGRFIEVQPFPAKDLGEWQDKVRVSPHTPGGVTHDDMFGQGGAANMLNWDMTAMSERLENDERCLGNGLAGWLVKAAIDRDVRLLAGTEVIKVIEEDGAAIGVVAVQDGKTISVRARRGVLLATSSYDWNEQLRGRFDRHPEYVSALPPSITGDHFRLAGRLGARVTHVPMVPNLGYHVTGEEQDDGQPLWRLAVADVGLPHCIVVNKAGRRFADEAFYPSVGEAVEAFDASRNEFANYPCWAIVDSQNVNKYPFGSVLPGQPFPEEMAASADTLEELAEKAGISPRDLADEVVRFNEFVAEGTDRDFDRGSKSWSHLMCGDPKGNPSNPNLGTLTEAPFYAIPLKPIGGGMCTTGLETDGNGAVLDWDGKPIPGLYAAGNSVAQRDIGAGYQSGLANGRGLVFGHLAAAHASGKPSAALDGSTTAS